MKVFKKIEFWGIIILLLLLLPFLWLSFYCYPSADDFCYAYLIKDYSFWHFQITNYSVWNGRFFSTFLFCISPLIFKSLIGYRLISLLLIVLVYTVLFVFYKKFLGSIKNNGLVFITSCSIFLWNLNVMPSTAESIYWMTASLTYHFSFVFLIAALIACYYAIHSKNKIFYLLLTLIFTILHAGFNELAAIFAVILATLWLLHEKIENKKWNKIIIFFLSTAILGFLIVLLAPGNAGRSIHYTNQANFIYAFSNAFIGLAKLFIIQFQSPFLLVVIAALMFTYNNIDKVAVNQFLFSKKGIFLLGLIFLVVIYLLYFVCYYALGLNPPLRVHGYLSLIFSWLFSIWFYFLFIGIIQPVIRKINFVINKNFAIILFFSGIALTILDFYKIPGNNFIIRSNIVQAYYDLFYTAKTYKNEQELREQKVVQNNENQVKSLTFYPRSIHFYELSTDYDHWVNKCFCKYFNTDSIRINKK